MLHRHAQPLLDVEDALLIVREPSAGFRLVVPETEREDGCENGHQHAADADANPAALAEHRLK